MGRFVTVVHHPHWIQYEMLPTGNGTKEENMGTAVYNIIWVLRHCVIYVSICITAYQYAYKGVDI